MCYSLCGACALVSIIHFLTLMCSIRKELSFGSFLAFTGVFSTRSFPLKIDIFQQSHPCVYRSPDNNLNIRCKATFELHKYAIVNAKFAFYWIKINWKSRHCYAKFT